MKAVRITVAALMLAYWAFGKVSLREMLALLVLAIPLALANRLPILAKVFGFALVCVPFWAWWKGAFAMQLGLIFLLLSLLVAGYGVVLIMASNDRTEYTDDEMAEAIQKAVGGENPR